MPIQEFTGDLDPVEAPAPSVMEFTGDLDPSPEQAVATPTLEAAPKESWRDTFASIPSQVRALAARTIAGMQLREFEDLDRADDRKDNSPKAEADRAARAERIRTLKGTIAETLNDPDAAPKGEQNILQRGVQGAAGSLFVSAPALAAGIATRNPVLATATTFPTTAGENYAELRNEGVKPERARDFSDLNAAIEVGTEFLPAKELFKQGSGPFKKLVRFLAAELPGESAATIGQEISGAVAKLPEDVTGAELLDTIKSSGLAGVQKLPETAVTTLLAGGAQSGAVSLADKAQTSVPYANLALDRIYKAQRAAAETQARERNMPTSLAEEHAEKTAMASTEAAAQSAAALISGAEIPDPVQKTIDQVSEESMMGYRPYEALRDQGLEHEAAVAQVARDPKVAWGLSAASAQDLQGEDLDVFMRKWIGRSAPMDSFVRKWFGAGKDWEQTLDQAATSVMQNEQLAEQSAAFEKARKTYETAEAAASDPSIRISRDQIQTAKQTYQQAVVDLSAAALNSGTLSPKQQKTVAKALQQAEAAGLTVPTTGTKGEVRADTKPNAELSKVETQRADVLNRIANADQVEQADVTQLVADGLAKAVPGGKFILTPEGRRQRKALQSRLDTIEQEELAAKEKAKPAQPKSKPLVRKAPTAAGIRAVAARKPVSVKSSRPAKKPVTKPVTLKLPAERRAAVRTALATKIEKDLAFRQRDKEADLGRARDFTKAKNQAADQTIAQAKYTQKAGRPATLAELAAMPTASRSVADFDTSGLSLDEGPAFDRAASAPREEREPAKPVGSFKAKPGRAETAQLFRGVPEGARETDTKGTLGNALFYAPDESVAKRYAGSKGKVHKRTVQFKNLLAADTLAEMRKHLGLGKTADLPEMIERSRELGYDGLRYDLKPDVEYVQIPPAAARSTRDTDIEELRFAEEVPLSQLVEEGLSSAEIRRLTRGLRKRIGGLLPERSPVGADGDSATWRIRGDAVLRNGQTVAQLPRTLEDLDRVYEALSAGETELSHEQLTEIFNPTAAARSTANPQTETPEFKKWFGDSKVVDKDGKPLVVYHSGYFDETTDPVPRVNGEGFHFGTKASAEARDYGKQVDDFIRSIRTSEGKNEAGDSAWFWSADGIDSYDLNPDGFESEEAARSDAERAGLDQDFSDVEPMPLTAAYLSIKNPKRTEDAGADWTEVVAKAKAEGYDGIVYRNEVEDKGKDSYIAFSATQIKSVNNTGGFDASNPDITRRASTEAQAGAKTFGAQLKDLAAEFKREYGVTVRIAETYQDLPPFPSDNILQNETQGVMLTYPDGSMQVWLVQGNLRDIETARSVAIHESVGHYGLRLLLGDKYAETMRAIRRSFPNQVRAMAKRSGYPWIREPGPLQEQFRNLAAEEIVAYASERVLGAQGKPQGIWSKIVTYVRTALRNLRIIKGMNEADIENLIHRAGDNLRRTAKAQRQYNARMVVARKADGPLFGMPTKAHIPGIGEVKVGPYQPARDAAQAYRERSGLGLPHPRNYVKVDPKFAERVAKAFDEMEHNPNDPEVARAYDAMIDETLAQYQAIKATGLKIELITGEDPYAASPRMAIEDVKNNNHLWVFPTETGFGQGEVQDSPLLRPTNEKLGDRVLLANDVFRIVHDYFGHIAEGNGFRADGEENAWRIHASMYSPLARAAMTTETRGQNSWLNYGPHGEKNRTAKTDETVFAPQKVGLLPKEFWEDPNAENILRRVKAKTAVVNIGLATPDGKGITAEEARNALRAIPGLRIKAQAVHQSDTEETLVATLDRPLTAEEGAALAETLRQDAIAQRTSDGNGDLFGPKAAEWGPYNPAYFLMPEGHRASEKQLSKGQKAAQDAIKGIGKYLTAQEKENLTKITAEGVVDLFEKLPSEKELGAAAMAGQAKRGWYRQSAEALVNVFGPDAPRFAALLAALSPQTSVESNLQNTVRIWKGWVEAGRPTDREKIYDVMVEHAMKGAGSGVLPAWVNNSVRALTAEDPSSVTLSGPKVNSFAANLRGNVEEVTLDTWMANFALVDQTIFSGKLKSEGNPGKQKGYLAYAARVRQTADYLTKLTGETWTPAEVQETVWSWAKATYEQTSSMGGLATAKELVESNEISDALINATPDFATLLHDEKYAGFLRAAGYGDALDRAYEAAAKAGSQGEKIEAPKSHRKHLIAAAERLDKLRELRDAESEKAEDPFNMSEDDVEVVRSVMGPKTGDPDVDSLLDKIGGKKRTLKQIWQDFTQDLGDRATQAAFDDLFGIKRAETLAGVPTKEQGYANARLSRSSAELTQAIVEYGPPVWEGDAANVDTKQLGLMQILQPLGDKVNLFLTYMVAKRAAGLSAQGRENLFTAGEITAGMALARKHPEFVVAAKQFARLNSQILDFAQEAGIINPETRALWENVDYIPFYRVMDTTGQVNTSTNAGQLGGVRNQIKKLTGGQNNIGDPLENIVRNWLALTDASLKAQATRTVVDNLNGSGFVKKIPNVEMTQAIVPRAEIKKALKNDPALAQTLSNLPPAAFAGLQKMMAVQAPTGDNVVTVWRNGKREYWESQDPLLTESLLNISKAAWGPLMEIFRFPKRVLTATVTTTPQFAAKNLWRDMWHAFVQGTSDGKTIVPMVDTIKGAIETAKMGADAKSMLAGGGSMTHGYIRGGDTVGATATIRKSLKKAKGAARVANTRTKLWHLYRDLLNASENAHRVAVYQRAVASGRSRKEALLESRDLLDFSMRGNNALVRFLVESVPFFNARLQGLYRLGRGGRQNPSAILLRGSLLALASVALLARNWDDERYKELAENQKNTYWHVFDVFEPGDHIQIPKPFEVGTIFGTVPEAIGDALFTNAEDPDAAKQSLKLMGHALGEVLSLYPNVQTAKPLVELAINKNLFTGSPILTQGDEGVEPREQDSPSISSTYRWLANAMPEVAPEALRSPKQLQHLGRGYVGNIQDYVLLVTDGLARAASGEPTPPAKATQDWPGLRDFYTKGVSRHTKYMDAMFEISDAAEKAAGSMKKAEEAENDARVEELEQTRGPLLDVREEFAKAKKEVIEIRKQMRAIQLDPDMTPDEKREEIDALQQDANDIAKDVYGLRPGGPFNLPAAAETIGATHTEQLGILKRNGLPATAELLNGLKQ